MITKRMFLIGTTWGDVKNIRNWYNTGRKQFRKVNDYWEYITGARLFSIYGHCTVFEEQQYEYTNVTEGWCDAEQGTWYEYGFEVEVKDYDGFLTVDSQMDWESVDDFHIYPLQGSNHLQVKNDKNTKKFIDATLRGDNIGWFGN